MIMYWLISRFTSCSISSRNCQLQSCSQTSRFGKHLQLQWPSLSTRQYLPSAPAAFRSWKPLYGRMTSGMCPDCKLKCFSSLVLRSWAEWWWGKIRTVRVARYRFLPTKTRHMTHHSNQSEWGTLDRWFLSLFQMLYVSPLWCFALQTNSRMFRVFEKVSDRAILTNLSRSEFRCSVDHKRNGIVPSRFDKFHCFDTQDPHSFVQRLTS